MNLTKRQRRDAREALKRRKELVKNLLKTGSFDGCTKEAMVELDKLIVFGTDVMVKEEGDCKGCKMNCKRA